MRSNIQIRLPLGKKVRPFYRLNAKLTSIAVWRKSRCTATYQSVCENDGLLHDSRELIGWLRHTRICAKLRRDGRYLRSAPRGLLDIIRIQYRLSLVL
jgi:hypothetical protein